MVTIDPLDTVLVLMDLQNDVVDPDGIFAVPAEDQARVDQALSVCARLLAWARAESVPVAHVAVTYRPGHPEVGDDIPLLAAVKANKALVEGSWGAEFHPSVAPAPGEWTVRKRGISAFAGSDLELLLRQSRRHSLLLAGVATQLVVLGTALAAADLGLRPLLVPDACAAAPQEVHTAALDITRAFAHLVPAEAILAPSSADAAGV
ncbi:isochorismatase family cysteine hydrolase [Streptomyces sp. NPDC048278]|uniref:cysteine hydrolase family protein n=1 Tax=Streptomyces sp. NPDC048278 TaxID=3155809 RepID=UPI00344A49D3